VELAAVAFDGAFTAERELNNLRVSRLEPWVGEIAVLEHHHGGMHSARAASPDYGGKGIPTSPPGLGGGFNPLLHLLGALGDAFSAAGGADRFWQTTGIFGPLADLLKAALPADTSALMLIAAGPAVDAFVSAVAPEGGQVVRQQLSDDQIDMLRLAATRK
jgi:uncharacterized membrane protein